LVSSSRNAPQVQSTQDALGGDAGEDGGRGLGDFAGIEVRVPGFGDAARTSVVSGPILTDPEEPQIDCRGNVETDQCG